MHERAGSASPARHRAARPALAAGRDARGDDGGHQRPPVGREDRGQGVANGDPGAEGNPGNPVDGQKGPTPSSPSPCLL